ncbi:MAG TPA: hypothetical protein VMR98_00005 [Candidatus Polarisedimenticolaceae bacterium]|nr:hypothetical protein [Candidatus Polarisedimenticolaceae bacterium]
MFRFVPGPMLVVAVAAAFALSPPQPGVAASVTAAAKEPSPQAVAKQWMSAKNKEFSLNGYHLKRAVHMVGKIQKRGGKWFFESVARVYLANKQDSWRCRSRASFKLPSQNGGIFVFDEDLYWRTRARGHTCVGLNQYEIRVE